MKKIQLSVPKPCHENWNEMTPDDQGRFCASCQKSVIDFSTMSDRQLATFFKKPSGSVCGRFHPDQLEREIEIPKKRIPWVRYFFTITLPAFLISCKLAGRQVVKGEPVLKEQHITGDTLAVSTPLIQGDVLPMPNDTLVVPPAPDIMGKVIFSRRDSNAQIDSVVQPKEPKIVKIERIRRCKLQAIATDGKKFGKVPFVYHPLHIQLNEVDHLFEPLTGIMGGLSLSRIPVRKKQKAESLVTPKQASSQQTFILVYPNPVNANAPLTVSTEGLQEGRYTVSIFSSNGAVLQQESVELSKEIQLFQLTVKSVARGIYFLRLQHEESGKNYTEKIIVN
ncbi:T9SS type A sorting domain-containing protein [Flavisolibacter ginsenosidimutans]|nr:T9SS type A sorting domain-containing protein [Flavisolibacter ginsenosidimutans]